MSEIKQENNQISAYQELNDFELEIICGGETANCNTSNILVHGKDFIPETEAFTKSEAA